MDSQTNVPLQDRHADKTFAQIMLMCLGFFGIQFGWALQMGNMSTIYARLGASEAEIPLLWLAAPITGLIVQPLVGFFSDRTCPMSEPGYFPSNRGCT